MALLREVENFLMEFKQKMEIYQIKIRDDRSKNSQALLDLEISPRQRLDIIESLTPEDYVSGPAADTLNAGASLWVFGKTVKKTPVYIKISMGPFNRPVICISFHPEEREMKYPFKKE